MHDHMEGHKSDQNPIEPFGQLSLGQFNSKEYRHNYNGR